MTDLGRTMRVLSLAAALTASLIGCQGTGEQQVDALYSTATVGRGSVANVVVMAGQVVAVNSRQLTMSAAGGHVLEIPVHLGQEVQQGQDLLRLDTTALERTLREAEADLEVAQAVLTAAEHQGGEIELEAAKAELAQAAYLVAAAELEQTLAEQAGLEPLQEAVDEAEVALQSARDTLHMAELGSNQATIRSLQYDLAFYQRMLRDLPDDDASRSEVQQRLRELERDLARAVAAREEALQAAQDDVEQKEATLAQAQAGLDRARSGEEDPADAARLAYQQALESHAQAQKKLEELQAGVESEALRAARTAYEAALAGVEGAQAAIAASTLKAPFPGLVLAIWTQVGAQVNPGDQLIFLADPKDLHVQAQVSEVDVPKLSVGQEARITFDAYPGQLYRGQVLSLPLQGQGSGGITFYQVETSLDADGADVRLSMLANVAVVIGERSNVLTVPAAALVYRTPDEIVVKLRDSGGRTREQSVQIGMNDGILAEVLSGLSEGQTVLVPLVPPSNPFGPRPY